MTKVVNINSLKARCTRCGGPGEIRHSGLVIYGECRKCNRRVPIKGFMYIGRGTKWGNKNAVKEHGRTEAITRYEGDLKRWVTTKDLEELDGKVLVCHCKPQSCHGDVLQSMLTLLKR